MNAYEEMLKGIKYVLDNCTAYRVSKDLNINARTINRYQNGTSPIDNMALETAGKIYNYYTKNKEEFKMERTHVIFSNNAGAPAEVIVHGKDEGFELQEVETAENEGKQYAHYYKEKFNEYDVLEWYYIETVNA